MYENRSSEKSYDNNVSDDEFDFCNTETGQKFAIKWSPSEDIKLISKHRFSGVRPMSRSVPRRKRNLFQYRINRSLNFEIGTPMPETVFKSPNFDSDDGQICNEKYLTRSAKILRSLNINFSPSNKRAKRINKTLNFDLSPSPKRIFSSAESICNKESPKFESNINRETKMMNKTLNFSSSSNGSNMSSYLGSSVNSIDENQNQTPSQRNRKVKKSLNYLTPSPERRNSNKSGSINGSSPMSRENFIDGLKHNALSVPKSKHYDGIGASTPRNLLGDFGDEDKEMRPSTPENVIQLVPESMSAIKKSHKKERRSNRSEKLYIHRLAEACDKTQNSSENPIVLSHSEERPATPITNNSFPSPNYSVGSIKQSHKKDKSKKKTVINYSDDEISDSGSIFDYTELEENAPAVDSESFNESSPLSGGSSGFQIGLSKKSVEGKTRRVDNSMEELSDQGSIFDYSEIVETRSDANMNYSPLKTNDCQSLVEKGPLKLSFDKLELISPNKCENNVEETGIAKALNEAESCRPRTPENVVNVMEQVMTDSIKKSHKKIKDKNKKKILFKSQVSSGLKNFTESSAPLPDGDPRTDDGDFIGTNKRHVVQDKIVRASTPENLNSSRLLLGQFSSVKKSHKKNKHKKIVNEFVKRQKYFNNNERRRNSDDSNCVSGVESLSSPCSSSGSSVSKRREPPLTTGDNSPMEINSSDVSPLEKSTPNKRKKSFTRNEMGISAASSANSLSMDYESAEEEFKIFTPIKKRRSLRAGKESLKTKNSQRLENSDKNCPTEDGSFKSLDGNSFSTPPNPNRSGETATKDRNDDPESRPCGEDSLNGRSTPQNRSTSIMGFDVNSIKKSHKKDKWNSRLRRHLNANDDDDDNSDFKPIRDEESSIGVEESQNDSDVELKSPKPSTSRNGISDCSETKNDKKIELARTPPNCSKVMNYLKLIQADSIKRSHKKMREIKRNYPIVAEPELSDDGSIFDSSDKIGLNESNESIGIIDPDISTGSRNETAANDANGNIRSSPRLRAKTPPNNSKSLIKIESIKKSHKKERVFKRTVNRDAEPDLSDDGSIFDAEEKLDESIDGVEKIEYDGRSSISN